MGTRQERCWKRDTIKKKLFWHLSKMVRKTLFKTIAIGVKIIGENRGERLSSTLNITRTSDVSIIVA